MWVTLDFDVMLKFEGIFLDQTSIVLVSGPYSLIFSSFIPFYFDIPVSSRLRIFGISFTDKSFIYTAGLQLLLSSWKRSLVPGICGIFSGSLYRLNAFGVRSIKFAYGYYLTFCLWACCGPILIPVGGAAWLAHGRCEGQVMSEHWFPPL